jgi:hypothetical protein
MHPHWKLLQRVHVLAMGALLLLLLLLLTTNSERVVVVLFDLLKKFRHVVNIIHGFGMSHNSANIQQTLVFLSAFLLQ